MTFYVDNKAASFQWKIFEQTKVPNHKIVNSKLRTGFIIVRNFSIYIACYHIKIDADREVKWTFDRAQIIFTEVMSNGKFYIKAYTEIDVLIILPHVYYTWDKSHSPSIYVL